MKLTKNFFQGGPHHLGVRIDTGPVANSDYALVYKHSESVDNLATFGSCVSHEVSRRRVGDYVGNDGFSSQAFDIEIETGVYVGKQAY